MSDKHESKSKKMMKNYALRTKIIKMLTQDGMSRAQIAKKLNIESKDVTRLISTLSKETNEWAFEQASSSWVISVKEMFVQTNYEIEELKNIAEKTKTPVAYTKVQESINEKRKYLISMMTQFPLYEKMVKLAEWHERHKQSNEVI